MSRLQTRRAQVAFEFVILVAVLFTALIIFTSFVRDNFEDAQVDTDYFKLKDIAISVKAEISLAVALEDGYRRDFFIPLTIDGLEYNISRENGFLMFASADAEYTVNVPTYLGDVQKGNNRIQKEDGLIEVNV